MRTVGLLLIAISAYSQTLSTKIAKILWNAPAAQQAFWGIHIVDLKTGATVYSKNAEQFFTPASNTKLFSTALALTRLGPDYRFRTTITSPVQPDESGRVTELRFVGGGDPNLSGRVLPYAYKSEPADPLRFVQQFADQLVEQGLRFVDGDIIGDDSAYSHEPFPDGWALDDPVYDYGVPVSALFLNDGLFTMRLTPTTPGQPPTIDCSPMPEGLVIHNRAVTGLITKLKFDRLPGSNELTVSGSIAEAQEESLGMEDPTWFAASALRQALIKRGVRVSGVARVEHTSAPGVALVIHDSAPLVQNLGPLNKDSINLHAEVVLLEVARVRSGVGSRENAIDELKSFLEEIGVEDRQYNFADGSGLSRHTLLTPLTITKLLTYMYKSENRDAWMSTLPVGGEDGTLAKRFSGSRTASQVKAKTGSITHVNALSGYAGRYAFSILVNNSNHQASAVRRVIDQLALALAR
jgi:D-alanyl-D-alanine carboxypeptidase/D-alanyl-D-alanine-endopeptidase (penicillin-binding protein 4)